MSIILTKQEFIDELKSSSYTYTKTLSSKTIEKDLEEIEGNLRGWFNTKFKLFPVDDNDHVVRIIKSLKSMYSSNEFEHGGIYKMVLALVNGKINLDIFVDKNHKEKNSKDTVVKCIWFRVSTHDYNLT